ncbi:facilitated trehalose transporter Tret1-like [Papilio machaon]|uniref:facilitated trehalose transporter Tret1-like n=1 Tax=Papilio machaon TaxID=76193 RepID=UPI001E664AED|nr:facilitated trehalose transporter Tret1-like [Papilio machaon]
MSLAWPSPMLVKLGNETESPLHRRITDEEGSWIASVGALCNTFTLCFLGMLIDRIGRKYCVILTCVPKILISIVFIFAKEAWVLILGRAVIGSADFFLFTAVPIYASEIADKETRGSLGTLLQMLSSLGIALTKSIGPFVSYTTYSIVFAAMNLLVAIPVLFLPDSPYYLYSKGKTNQAMNTLTSLRGSEELAKEELAMYSVAVNTEKVNKIKLLKDRVFLKSLGIAIVLCIMSQFTGFNAVSYYLQTILVSTNTNVMPEVASLVISLIQILAAICAAIVTDRWKRTHILLSSFIGIFIGLVALGLFFKLTEEKQEVIGFLNYLPMISLIIVIYCYSAGIGSLFWVLVPELFDGPGRALGVTIAMVVVSFLIFITTKFFPLLTMAIGPAMTYWSFSIICVISCIYVYFCIPDTNGKTFNEIQKELSGEEAREINEKNDK